MTILPCFQPFCIFHKEMGKIDHLNKKDICAKKKKGMYLLANAWDLSGRNTEVITSGGDGAEGSGEERTLHCLFLCTV